MKLPLSGSDDNLIGLGIALALGLLVGLEREWADDKPIGMRSFALIALLGGISALFIESVGAWPVAGGLVALGLVLADRTRRTNKGGITTLVAGLVVFTIGAAAAAGLWVPAIVMGGVVTLILHWKRPMHGMVDRLGRDDLETIARFVLITLVILPILPDQTFGPYEVFNPFNTWLLVVLIVSINLAGYIAFRLVGASAGGWLAGIIGGMVSSTATTFSYSALSRDSRKLGGLVTLVILVASTMVYPRVAVEISVVAPSLLKHIVWPSVAFATLLLVTAGVVSMRMPGDAAADLPRQSNPARIKTALSFGAVYVVVLFAVAAARDFIGNDAVYAVAFASGLTDVDALTLSTSRLFDDGKIDADTAWRAIFLASLSNLMFKTGVAAVIGSPSLRRFILATGIPAIVAGAAILLLWP
jgi:uncharacterized membrane protein (DUF4010 family)